MIILTDIKRISVKYSKKRRLLSMGKFTIWKVNSSEYNSLSFLNDHMKIMNSKSVYRSATSLHSSTLIHFIWWFVFTSLSIYFHRCWLSMENLAKLAFIIPVCLVVCVSYFNFIRLLNFEFTSQRVYRKLGWEQCFEKSVSNKIRCIGAVFCFTSQFVCLNSTLSYIHQICSLRLLKCLLK